MTNEQINAEFFKLRQQVIEKDFKRMNNMQKQAIFQTEGPILILAGAGSGKTTVLVNRIANIIKYGKAYNTDRADFAPSEMDLAYMKEYLGGNEDVRFDFEDLLHYDSAKPWQVLAITFTNKAATELKERLSAMLGEDAKDIWAATFHSACGKILRMNAQLLGYTSSFTIYDTDDAKRLIKECQRQLGIKDADLPHKSILNEISSAKDKLKTPAEYKLDAGDDAYYSRIAKVYEMYQKELVKSNSMDFDDIIVNVVTLLQNHEDVRKYYQRKFKYVMVDEYQDTNFAQYKLIELLSDGHKNICVVGDDDQSIYKFRGATIENILNFENRYKNAKVIRLEQNYRSTNTILDAANEVISNNTNRKGKKLWSANGRGEKIVVNNAYSESEEAQFVTKCILDNVASGKYKFNDHAILYRMNAQSNAMEMNFVRSGVPYRIIGGHRFYERLEIRDAIAYLTVINNPNDNIKLRRIINVPKRGIGDTSVNKAFEIATGLDISLFEVISHADEYEGIKRASAKLMAFAKMIQEFHDCAEEANIDVLFEEVMRTVEYAEHLKLDKLKGAERAENIGELKSNLVKYRQENEEASLSDFLEEVSLMTDLDNYDADSDTTVMMTLHSAKGLEFPVVFIVGFEDGIFPGIQSTYNTEDLEEERRLAYVGITRAKQKLVLSHCSSRMLFGQTSRNPASRFLKEISDDLLEKTGGYTTQNGRATQQKLNEANRFSMAAGQKMQKDRENLNKQFQAKTAQKTAAPLNYSVGDSVNHKTFGNGVILSIRKMGNDSMIEIAFANGATKKLMANYAKLDKI
ncbi:MAG: 3'-5' exonuclease [Clostridia bacterium]